MPRADRRRVRRLQVIVAIITLLLAAGIGWLGFARGPHMISDLLLRSSEQSTSPNTRWQVRLTDFNNYWLGSTGTTWAQVRRAGTVQWRTVYVGNTAKLSWQGDTMTFTESNDATPHLVDARDGRYGAGPHTMVLPAAVVFLVLVCGILVGSTLLIVLAPHRLGRRGARALVVGALSRLRAGEWLQAAELFRVGWNQLAEHADLAARLPSCQAAILVNDNRWRVERLQPARDTGTPGWTVTVRFLDDLSDFETRDQAAVLATADAWLLLPDTGLFAGEKQATQQIAYRQRANRRAINALTLGVISCLANLIPLGILGGLLALAAVSLAVHGCVSAHRSGGSTTLAAVALGASGLGLLLAFGQAVLGYVVFSSGP